MCNCTEHLVIRFAHVALVYTIPQTRQEETRRIKEQWRGVLEGGKWKKAQPLDTALYSELGINLQIS